MAKPRPTVVLFGDSLTQFSFGEGGWGAALANAYQRRADVLFRGLSGYNTRWALEVMDAAFPASNHSPALVTLFFGANDSALPDRHSARQHVPLDEYAANLTRMVRFLRDQRGAGAVVLITPPPVYEPALVESTQQRDGKSAETEAPTRTNEVTGRYAAACCRVAADEGCPVLNLWEGFQAVEGWRTTLLNDGLHFTVEGQREVWTQLEALMADEERLAAALPPAMPLDFPLHRDIDPTDHVPTIKRHFT
eukprot:CAMPEP_0177770758 /NCGR_PEP_ID=MMETSP0491_2-20121128/11132_1 /TAXON_ID=63592 /ORGANISM="Tetraselmis chuii, Strain PLY429" /LENGTH=249 /DNA_ID=CAMNT_0019288067 /DNA_START=174 /DNA_END=923 /DNA_ORIENTATION=+